MISVAQDLFGAALSWWISPYATSSEWQVVAPDGRCTSLTFFFPNHPGACFGGAGAPLCSRAEMWKPTQARGTGERVARVYQGVPRLRYLRPLPEKTRRTFGSLRLFALILVRRGWAISLRMSCERSVGYVGGNGM